MLEETRPLKRWQVSGDSIFHGRLSWAVNVANRGSGGLPNRGLCLVIVKPHTHIILCFRGNCLGNIGSQLSASACQNQLEKDSKGTDCGLPATTGAMIPYHDEEGL